MFLLFIDNALLIPMPYQGYKGLPLVYLSLRLKVIMWNEKRKSIQHCVVFQDNGGCHHNCSNTPGSYQCTCHPTFRLQIDGKTCGRKLSVSLRLVYLGKGPSMMLKGCQKYFCGLTLEAALISGWIGTTNQAELNEFSEKEFSLQVKCAQRQLFKLPFQFPACPTDKVFAYTAGIKLQHKCIQKPHLGNNDKKAVTYPWLFSFCALDCPTCNDFESLLQTVEILKKKVPLIEQRD